MTKFAKQLEWEEPSGANNHCNVAKTPLGDYYVHQDGGFCQAWCEFGSTGEEQDISKGSGKLWKEQMICQEHYENMVASMISPYARSAAEAIDNLQVCMGFTQNGSERSVTLFQDDATKSWHMNVNGRPYWSETGIADLINKAAIDEEKFNE